jgi:hypothetical protein
MTFRSKGRVTAYCWASLGCLIATSGCHRTVVVHAAPVEAAMLLPDGDVLLTPTRVTVPTYWFASYPVEVSAPGYGTYTVDLAGAGIGGWSYYRAQGRYQPERLKTKNPAVVLQLIPDHPPPQ